MLKSGENGGTPVTLTERVDFWIFSRRRWLAPDVSGKTSTSTRARPLHSPKVLEMRNVYKRCGPHDHIKLRSEVF